MYLEATHPVSGEVEWDNLIGWAVSAGHNTTLCRCHTDIPVQVISDAAQLKSR